MAVNTDRLTFVSGNHEPTDPVSVEMLRRAAGTSIFDPVLCELVYRWFAKTGSVVLDPFAGGSVRGVVAGALGRRYYGIDLSEPQVNANRDQWAEIGVRLRRGEMAGGLVRVRVSAKQARQAFNGCEPDYIKNVCHAACCRSTTAPTGTMVTIHPTEEEALRARGAEIHEGLMLPRAGERKCRFEGEETHLCELHETTDKPFGCIASPFTLTRKDTLIVRNRYRLLRCYNDGARIPAYKAFRSSLNLIFGEAEAQRISDHLEGGGGDLDAWVPIESYRKLVDNDAIKAGKRVNVERFDVVDPEWIVGDSRDVRRLTSDLQADLLFSCPPYGNLEVYSDDPRDVSNLSYVDFLAAYRNIIHEAVSMLADDRFAVFVVGDLRGKDGYYQNFVGDTITAFLDAGMRLYNEAVFVTKISSLPFRTRGQFVSGRKFGKAHQNVLVFVKGNWKRAVEYCGDVQVALPDGMLVEDGTEREWFDDEGEANEQPE